MALESLKGMILGEVCELAFRVSSFGCGLCYNLRMRKGGGYYDVSIFDT